MGTRLVLVLAIVAALSIVAIIVFSVGAIIVLTVGAIIVRASRGIIEIELFAHSGQWGFSRCGGSVMAGIYGAGSCRVCSSKS